MADAPKIVIYAIPAGQFPAKVLVALDARNIPHYVKFVELRDSKRALPSGGNLTPEMTFNEEIVPGSDDILQYLDGHLNTGFFPPNLPAVTEICGRASTKLAAYVWYYNWLNEPTWRDTMASIIEQRLPCFICFCRDKVVDIATSSKREEFHEKVCDELDLDEDDLLDEPQMRENLVMELSRYQSELKSEQQPYIIASTTRLTAADAAVYTQVERLVGDMGDMGFPPALPELLEDERLVRLWKWHSRMREQHPIKFKGKRVPDE